ncbi:MAG: amino acid-binding protein [Halobacteriota archaeon]|nr:amino acid-binding protein [Halobacteriota archaeon]
MIVSLDLELRDIPGQLSLALKPISESGANIVGVIHHREKMTPRHTLPVQVTVEVDQKRLESLIDKLKSEGIIVARVGEERLKERVLVMLTGHILDTDVKDTVDAVDNTGFAEVVDLKLSMPGIDKRSSASLVINAMGEKELCESLNLLREIASKKDLLMITPIGF